MKGTKKPTLYLESTVVSYAIGRISSLAENARKQKFKREWWKTELHQFTPVISTYVFGEISDGDDRLSVDRRKLVWSFRLLLASDAIDKLAKDYIRLTKLPEKARLDAYHIACATIYEIDYLVTWNLNHILNGFIRKMIEEINRVQGVSTPIICTPEELTEVP